MKRQETGNSILLLQYVAFGILLYGFKLWVIHNYGNATPHWDQWDGEAANLYKPFSDGTLEFKALFAPHNEHRIFTTRLLALGLLKINVLWNPLLQMIVNAVLHIAAIILNIHLLLKVTGKKYQPLLLIFSFILFFVPYAWENTLGGFQSQFYFVLIFSIGTLWYTLGNEPFSKKWWIGIVCAILAFFSLASGVFAIGAALVVSIIFYITGLGKSWKQLLAIAILLALLITGMLLTPVLPDHASLKAASVAQFYSAFVNTLSWPLVSGFSSALIRNTPALLFSIILLWKRPPVNDGKWVLLGLIAWSVGQSMSIAYGRAASSLSSRYLDLFAMCILINFACLISLLKDQLEKRNGLAYAGLIGWLAFFFIGLRLINNDTLSGALNAKHAQGLEQEKNVRNFVTTGNPSILKHKLPYDIPYPDPERLGMILNWPEIRNILPTNIRPDGPAGRLDAFTNWILAHYYLFMITGLAGILFITVYHVRNLKRQ